MSQQLGLEDWLWYVRRIFELSGDSVPIDSLKEFVLHDVTYFKANARVGNENLADQVSRHRVQVLW